MRCTLMAGELCSLPWSVCRSSPGPAVVPPTAASALLMKVAMFCSLAVGGRPPTYTRRACRVACWLGAASAAAEPAFAN